MKQLPSSERLLELVEKVDAALAHANVQTGALNYKDSDNWFRRHEAVVDELQDKLRLEGAVFGEKPPHDHWVRLAGIRSSSTSGFEGALRNWITAALKRTAIGATDRAALPDVARDQV